jgi:hypothetical protein
MALAVLTGASRRSWALLLLAVLLQPVTGWGWLARPAQTVTAAREAFICRPAGVDVELAPAEKQTRLADARLKTRCDAAPPARAPRVAPPRSRGRHCAEQFHLQPAPALEQRPVRGPPSLLG